MKNRISFASSAVKNFLNFIIHYIPQIINPVSTPPMKISEAQNIKAMMTAELLLSR